MNKASPRAARDRMKAEQLRQQRRRQQIKLFTIIGSAVVILVLVVGGGYLYGVQDENGGEFEGELAPQVLQEDGSVVMAAEDAQAPVVESYSDFQCPACQDFEEVNAATLDELAADGAAIVHLRPVSIFATQDETLGANSLRAGAAARAAADHDRYVEYSELLWQNQPGQGAEGFAPEDLVEWGTEVGIDDSAFADRVEAESELVDRFYDDSADVDLNGSYVQEILEATAAVNERYPSGGADEFVGTPSVYVNGELLGDEIYSSGGLNSAVEDAEPGSVDTQPADDSATQTPDADEGTEDDDSADDADDD